MVTDGAQNINVTRREQIDEEHQLLLIGNAKEVK